MQFGSQQNPSLIFVSASLTKVNRQRRKLKYVFFTRGTPCTSGFIAMTRSPPELSRLNCGVGQWTTAVTRIQPAYSGGFWFGSEFVASENKEQRSKVVIDVRLTTVYFGPARTYTEISDLLQALTYQQDFLRVGAQVGLTLQASKTFLFHLRFGLAHDTDHWLTSESLGQPASGSSTVDVGSTQQSPNFDFRYDNPGSRFLLQNSLIGSLGADVELRF